MQANGVAIVGLGNALAHDDAAGLEAVRRLRAQAEAAGIAVREHEGSPLALLDLWEGLDGVVLVDAVHGAGAPGSIHRFDASADAIPARLSRSASTHAVGAGEAIELGRTLARLPRSVLFVGVEGARFDAGAGLSTDVEDALDALAATALSEALAVAAFP